MYSNTLCRTSQQHRLEYTAAAAQMPTATLAVHIAHTIHTIVQMNEPLRDLSAIPRPPAVSMQPAGHLYASSHQQRWPVHSVEAQYVLANNVHISRPVLSKGAARLSVRIAECTDVVGQSIYPYIHDVSWVAWDRDAPVKAGARDAQVSQPSFDKAQHFVLAACGAASNCK
jgi:hypothetical protein